METLRRSWELVKTSWSVLILDKELVLYPLVSGALLMLLFTLTFVPALLLEAVRSEALLWSLLAVAYFIGHFITQYFNAALISSALVRLKGGDPTFRTGIKVANRRLKLILQWSLLAATVGLLLSMLKNKSDGWTRLFGGLLEMGWNLVSYLVIPVMVVEGKSPLDAIQRSKEMLKATWGEQLGASIGFGVIAFIAMIPVAVLSILLMSVTADAAIGATFGIGAGVLVILVTTTLGGVYQAALFLYAKEKVVPPGFAAEQLRNSFR